MIIISNGVKKLIIIGTIVLASIVVIVFYGAEKNNSGQIDATIKVATSFYPLAEFVKGVGGENVEVINITPPGSEPHDYEPTPQDIARVNKVNIFIFNGSNFDPWAEKIAPGLERDGVVTLNMTDHFDLTADEAGEPDPHIWLDPVLVKQQVEIIRDTLQKVDAINSAIYENNAREYLGKLSELDQKFQSGLASCEIRETISSHAAFGYLAKRYNINIIPISGLSPEEEPSPKKMAEITQLAKQKNIKYIFFETLVSPKLSETIAREIGAKTLMLNPVEGLTDEEIKSGKSYITEMEKNLENLKVALICK